MSASKLDLSARSLSVLHPLSQHERVADGYSALASTGTRTHLIPSPAQSPSTHSACLQTPAIQVKHHLTTLCKPCHM